ncbi:hypothetical protein QYE76_046456 [Lolium multiflorum]|uniref:Auxin-responsive protein n=1 Tax=Lolium multiflorum TaxID=4521 RepID=A0AAD8X133_LOLMU|nr:hypothetical protein QYE76_046456 [Lolium multiflorum]
MTRAAAPTTASATAAVTAKSKNKEKEKSEKEASLQVEQGGTISRSSIYFAQATGWPLVRAYRRNTFHAAVAAKKAEKLFLKVRIDGVPYISKVALRMYKGVKLYLLPEIFNQFKNHIRSKEPRSLDDSHQIKSR